MSERVSAAPLIVLWAFSLMLAAFVLLSSMAPPQSTPWLAGFALALAGTVMAMQPRIFGFAHSFGVRLAGIFILGVGAVVAVARLIEFY